MKQKHFPDIINLEEAIQQGFEKEEGKHNKDLVLYRKAYEGRYQVYVLKERTNLKPILIWLGSYPSMGQEE